MRVILLLLMSSSIFAQDMKKIPSWDLGYYKKHFKEAFYYSTKDIQDNIGVENTEILFLYNKNYEHIGHIREVFTDTGCGGVCAPLFFTIAFDKDGRYLNLVIKEGDELYKGDDRDLFSEEDYNQLDSILQSPPTNLLTINDPKELLEDFDGRTGATKKVYENYFIKSAALSCFRVLQYSVDTEYILMSK